MYFLTAVVAARVVACVAACVAYYVSYMFICNSKSPAPPVPKNGPNNFKIHKIIGAEDALGALKRDTDELKSRQSKFDKSNPQYVKLQVQIDSNEQLCNLMKHM